MSVQSFRRVRIDINDTLYSQIIRHGVERCLRCILKRNLQCAHIIGRGAYSTRFMLEPKANAVPLCSECHDWFDSHKMRDVIFEPEKRVFTWKDESYTFLVEKCGYTWRDLAKLYIAGQQPCREKYTFWKKAMTAQLRRILKTLDEATNKEAA